MIAEQSMWVEPLERLAAISSDESDNRYLECAVEGGAQYIISGDKHLLELGEYRGIAIVSAADFIALLEMDNVQV